MLLAFLILISTFILSSDQQAFPAAVGRTGGTGNTGQVAYKNLLGPAGSISMGVKQPFEIYVNTSLQDANDFTCEFSAYPYPATDQVTTKIENYNTIKLHIRLYDASSKLLQNLNIISNEIIILLTNLTLGSYLLEVFNCQNVIRSFIILKYQTR